MDGDDASLDLLTRRGFARPDQYRWYAYHVRKLDEAVTPPQLPDGFTLRTMRGADDLHERVEVHRAVWAPSRLTEESYRNVMRAWPYRADLDCLLEAPDGTFAAYVLCWYDQANEVGELEPVGTHPTYRGRWFGAAVCRYRLLVDISDPVRDLRRRRGLPGAPERVGGDRVRHPGGAGTAVPRLGDRRRGARCVRRRQQLVFGWPLAWTAVPAALSVRRACAGEPRLGAAIPRARASLRDEDLGRPRRSPFVGRADRARQQPLEQR